MFHVMLDTSVWLDIAQDPRQTPFLDPLIGLLSGGQMNVLVPKLVLDEFKRNRKRVADSAKRSLSSHFNVVTDTIRKLDPDPRSNGRVLGYLMDLDYRSPLVGGVAEGTLDRIQKIFDAVTPIETSDQAKLRAADRALRGSAPCHHQNKNSIADAMLLETYVDCVRAGRPRDRFAFVTHNKADFSDGHTNNKHPHPDLAQVFSKIRSLYFTSLPECLRRIDSHSVSGILRALGYEFEPRSIVEQMNAATALEAQIWYGRHKQLAQEVEEGRYRVVTAKQLEQAERDGDAEVVLDTIWRKAQREAKRIEREMGATNIGPWSDFEWGMLNGKLSALRWVFGDEWDMLDT